MKIRVICPSSSIFLKTQFNIAGIMLPIKFKSLFRTTLEGLLTLKKKYKLTSLYVADESYDMLTVINTKCYMLIHCLASGNVF